MSATMLAERFPQTWEDVKNAEVGHAFVDEFDEGVRFIILRGPGSLCAYVGVSVDHPLAGWDYDDLPVSAHGGLTYSGINVHGDGSTYWYGWDYNHSGDKSAWDSPYTRDREEKEWTPAMVYSDAWEPRWEFKKLVRLVEKIQRRPAHNTGTDRE